MCQACLPALLSLCLAPAGLPRISNAGGPASSSCACGHPNTADFRHTLPRAHSLSANEGKGDRLIELLKPVVACANSSKEPGCKTYRLNASADKKTFAVFEEYVNEDALNVSGVCGPSRSCFPRLRLRRPSYGHSSAWMTNCSPRTSHIQNHREQEAYKALMAAAKQENLLANFEVSLCCGTYDLGHSRLFPLALA